jgi:hypothetical protein
MRQRSPGWFVALMILFIGLICCCGGVAVNRF